MRPINLILAILTLLVCLAPARAADPTLATINCGSGAAKNTPVSVATTATEGQIVFNTSSGDNPQIQFVDTADWTWSAVIGSTSATQAVAATQTWTIQLDGGALQTVVYVTRKTANGILTVTRVR